MADWIEEGKKAPAFSLKATNGKTVKLSDFKGKNVVLYFYPKDDTPGCTKEACAFRDRHSEIEELGAVVLGVSPDDVASHGKFTEKFQLNFPLLADTDHALAEKFGAWREKNMYGRNPWVFSDPRSSLMALEPSSKSGRKSPSTATTNRSSMRSKNWCDVLLLFAPRKNLNRVLREKIEQSAPRKELNRCFFRGAKDDKDDQ